MMKTLHRTTMIVALGLTAACNGGGNGVITERPDVEDVTERLDRVDTMRDRIDGYAGTSFDAIPDTGKASFSGIGQATIDRNGANRTDDINLVGYVAMTANFENGTLTGDMSNIQGYTGSSARADTVFDANGVIEIGERSSELEFLRNGPTNNWSTDYLGTLDTPEGRIRLDGMLDGQFRGTRLNMSGDESSIRALMGDDADGIATIDGEATNGMTFEVMGLN